MSKEKKEIYWFHKFSLMNDILVYGKLGGGTKDGTAST